MAEWKVIAAPIQIFPHPNADSLFLAKVGQFQLVVGKSSGYKDGDVVVFAPERSVLPDDLKGEYVNSETGISYLAGDDHNRVKRVRLRGEYSEGVTINPAYVEAALGCPVAEIAPGVDISGRLGITKYEPPIPASMAGEIEPISVQSSWHTHDVEQFRLYQDEFVEGDPVVVTEKLHGSQGCFYWTPDGKCFVTSKGFAKKQQGIKESQGNIYWRAARNTGLFEIMAEYGSALGYPIQVFGEVFPCQGKNFMYGQTEPTLRLFRVVVDGLEWSLEAVRNTLPELAALWVPVLYEGPFNVDVLVPLAEGKEQVSGKETGIREGIVISPRLPRQSSEGFPLFLKIVNTRFKDSEEFVA